MSIFAREPAISSDPSELKNTRFTDTSQRLERLITLGMERERERDGHDLGASFLGAAMTIAGLAACQLAMGSSMTAQRGDTDMSALVVNCMLASAASAAVAVGASRLASGRWSVRRITEALTAGVAVVSCGGGALGGWHCLVLGASAGALYLTLRNVFPRLNIPDLGAQIAGSTASGTLSLLVTPALLFSARPSWPHRLAWNVVGTLVMASWGFILTLVAVVPLQKLNLLRQSPEDNAEDGLDGAYTRERVVSILPIVRDRNSCRDCGIPKRSAALFPGRDETKPIRVSVSQLETPRVLAPTPSAKSLKSPPRYSRAGTEVHDGARRLSKILDTDPDPFQANSPIRGSPSMPLTTFNATSPATFIPQAPPLPPPGSVSQVLPPVPKIMIGHQGQRPPAPTMTRKNIHAGLKTLRPLPQDAKRRESLEVRRKVTPLPNDPNNNGLQ